MTTTEPTLDASSVALTSAYVVKGATEYLHEHGKTLFDLHQITGRAQGELEFIDLFAGYAMHIETVYQTLAAADDPEGVWDYEVSEPLGAWLAADMLGNGEITEPSKVHDQISKLAAVCFGHQIAEAK